MLIIPAIDLYEGKAVRLYKGDYSQMTIYSDHPEEIALHFKEEGAGYLHIVDLEGAASGKTPNMETILKIKEKSGLRCEVGGGIRSMDVIDSYLSNGIDRVILGTAAIEDPDLLKKALDRYAEKIAVGVDLKDGKIATHGWKKTEEENRDTFFVRLQELGVRTIICTDISRDGAMQGSNFALYQELSEKYAFDLIASGGVSSLEDIRKLKELDIYGAIIGKACYSGALSIKEAVEVTR